MRLIDVIDAYVWHGWRRGAEGARHAWETYGKPYAREKIEAAKALPVAARLRGNGKQGPPKDQGGA